MSPLLAISQKSEQEPEPFRAQKAVSALCNIDQRGFAERDLNLGIPIEESIAALVDALTHHADFQIPSLPEFRLQELMSRHKKDREAVLKSYPFLAQNENSKTVPPGTARIEAYRILSRLGERGPNVQAWTGSAPPGFRIRHPLQIQQLLRGLDEPLAAIRIHSIEALSKVSIEDLPDLPQKLRPIDLPQARLALHEIARRDREPTLVVDLLQDLDRKEWEIVLSATQSLASFRQVGANALPALRKIARNSQKERLREWGEAGTKRPDLEIDLRFYAELASIQIERPSRFDFEIYQNLDENGLEAAARAWATLILRSGHELFQECGLKPAECFLWKDLDPISKKGCAQFLLRYLRTIEDFKPNDFPRSGKQFAFHALGHLTNDDVDAEIRAWALAGLKELHDKHDLKESSTLKIPFDAPTSDPLGVQRFSAGGFIAAAEFTALGPRAVSFVFNGAEAPADPPNASALFVWDIDRKTQLGHTSPQDIAEFVPFSSNSRGRPRFSPDGRRLLSYSNDWSSGNSLNRRPSSVDIWEIPSFKNPKSVRREKSFLLSSPCWNLDGKSVWILEAGRDMAMAGKFLDLRLLLWDLEKNALETVWEKKLQDEPRALSSFKTNGRVLAYQTSKTLSLLDLQEDKELSSPEEEIQGFEFLPGTDRLLLVSSDGAWQEWSALEGRQIRKGTLEFGRCDSMAISPDANYLLTSHTQRNLGTLLVRQELSSGKTMQTIEMEGYSPPPFISLSSDGKKAITSNRHTVSIWRIE